MCAFQWTEVSGFMEYFYWFNNAKITLFEEKWFCGEVLLNQNGGDCKLVQPIENKNKNTQKNKSKKNT